MKESLQLLQIYSSGLTDRKIIDKTDDDIYSDTLHLTECCDQVAYLRDLISERTTGFRKSKKLLATLTKKCDKEFACKLAQSLCYETPVDSENYILFAEIAIEHQAWEVAKSALEIAVWGCNNEINEIKQIKQLSDYIKSNETLKAPTYRASFWNDKQISKSWVIERISQLYDQATTKDYAFSLLETYPNSHNNYTTVFKVFSKYEDKDLNQEYLNYITNKQNLSKKTKDLYTGLLYHELGKYKQSSEKLLSLLSSDPKENSTTLFFIGLNHLILHDLENFKETFNKLMPGYTPEFTALYFIYCALSNTAINENAFGDKNNIAYEITKITRKILGVENKPFALEILSNLESLGCSDIANLTKAHLSEYFIKNNQLDVANQFLESCKHHEAHRLKAWIHRIQHNEDKAEEELVTYRTDKSFHQSGALKLELINLKLPYDPPNNKDELIELLKGAYTETKQLVQDLELESGTNPYTCMETKCQDCCKKSVPYISYIEYLYLKEWLDKQDQSLQTHIKTEANRLKDAYKTKYRKDPPFIKTDNINNDKSYPLEFTFACPFLGENKCNAYESRPFMCRAYGSGSLDGRSFKGCNYFFAQLVASSDLNATRKVINIGSFNDFSKKSDIKLIGSSVIAPIPFWFAEEHDEIVEKIRSMK